jgi:formamidase
MTRISVDTSRPLREAPSEGHNRWHPDLEPIARVAVGTELTLETRTGFGRPIHRGLTSADLAFGDRGVSHEMTGPVYVEGAAPGDLLQVEILALEHADVGVTGFIPGFGLLGDLVKEPYLMLWELADGHARSAQLPGIAVPGATFPGVIGVAPSAQRLAEYRRREDELRRSGVAIAEDAVEAAVPRSAAAGVRSLPPRETGGNMDSRGLVAGSRVILPVDVAGALFSVGDLHFAQGDGEVCGTAIETAGAITVRFTLEKRPAWRPRFPIYETPAAPQRAYLATTGLPIDPEGRNAPMDLTLAARGAVLEMINYLSSVRGLSREAAYALCSCVVELRISQVVDVPNPVVSALLPLDIFTDRPAAPH